MYPHHSDHMSQGSQISQGALWQCFSTMSWSEGVSDGATYRAVPLFSEGQLKIDTHLFMNQSTRKRNGKTKRDVGSKS